MGGLGVNNIFKENPVERLMSFFKARFIRLPVMSLAYSASVLAKDFDVEVIDAANLGLGVDETLRCVEELRPQLVISTTSISTLMQEVELVCVLKERLGVKVGLAGDAATHMSRFVMGHSTIDFIIKGNEPEFTLEHFAQAGGYENLNGIVFRQGESIKDTGEPTTIINLDSLPFPIWELFPIDSYRYFPMLRRTPFLTMLSTRGCPYGCIYCPYTSNQGVKYRHRSVWNVIDEFIALKQKYNIRAVQFRDPTFTIRKERTLEICDGILKNGIDIEWGCETRVDRLDEELIDRMLEAGLGAVNIGIESTAPEVINNIHRGWIDPNHVRRMVQYMANKGIRVSGFFVLGLPGETKETIHRTLDFAVEIPLSYAEFKIATPFPGTPLFEMAKKNKWIEEINIEQYTSYTPSMRISHQLDSEYLKSIASRPYRNFYMQPRRIAKQLSSPSFLLGLASLPWQ
jgi:radical SAM superfamily enzyme YgiQ (UPF0313 family)